LKYSGLKFGAIIFNEKYSDNMDKFTTTGLRSQGISKICVKYHFFLLWLALLTKVIENDLNLTMFVQMF
jgi:hypothetical protein